MTSLEKINTDPYKSRADIIEKTANQVIKDFATFGLEVHFSGDAAMAYNELSIQLYGHITVMVENHIEKLQALLYHIDVNEKAIRRALEEYPDWSYAEIVTEMILQRELKKVAIREYIKENPDWINQ
ncbi:MAG TPA: hypothetical protein VJ939_02400 [Bacteroidales bacterium]|nr:hypothetical protein [Bacteroidales bacterium]